MAGGRRPAAFRADGSRQGEPAPLIVGVDIAVHDVHADQVQETEGNRRKLKTKRELRNRLKVLIQWLKEHYPEYADAGGVVAVSREHIADPQFFQHTNAEDLYYEGINVALIKAFLASTKKKTNGKICCHSNLRKFHDAILFGAEQAGEVLPRLYHQEMNKFLDSFKKETVKAKREGNVDERDSDQIPFPLYRLICDWALDAGNIFAWVFTVCQWNCMARSASIDPLGIHNFSRGIDSFKVTYDDSKSDGTGERVSPKNLYANPFDPTVCPATALGLWLALRNETFVEHRDGIFLQNGQIRSAAHRYCAQLVDLLSNHEDEVIQYCRIDRVKSHGIRKGAATHSTSGTTLPPPLPSVARRGEWSQGTVFDIYFLFAEPGDQYLGRCLAGLPSNSVDFAVLPPHFPCGIENADVCEALYLCYGNIIELYEEENGGLVGVLLLLLASVVFHIDTFVCQKIQEHQANYPFAGLRLLQYPDLVGRLKEIVTTEPTANHPLATGIPPHIEQLQKLTTVLEGVTNISSLMLAQVAEVKTAVVEAIEERDVRGGIITIDFLQQRLRDHHQELEQMIGKGLEEARKMQIDRVPHSAIGGQDVELGRVAQTEELDNGNIVYPIYCYDGKFWHAPRDWKFAEKMYRRAGWSLWLNGQPGVIRPFRLLDSSILSPDPSLRSKLKLIWRPIFQMMELAPGLHIPRMQQLPMDFVEESYKLATEYLKIRAGYIWDKCKRPEMLCVSSWSTRVLRSNIEKFGNETDRQNLPPPQRVNEKHSHVRHQRRRQNQGTPERARQRSRVRR